MWDKQYAEKAFDLIKELERSNESIPPFQDEEVRQILEEVKAIYEENVAQAATITNSGDKSLWPLLNYRHSALQRNKRCLLAYLYERLRRIRCLRWEYGPVIPADIKANLCEPEINYFNNYSKSLASYMLSIGDGEGIDLTTDLKPPKTLFVEVRCIEEYGKFELEDGEVVNFTKNSQHYLPRQQVEALIRQGILEHIVQ